MSRREWWGLAMALLTLGETADGQTVARRGASPPVIGSIAPPGGQVGTTVAWSLTGRGFSKAKQLLVSGDGVETLEFEAQNDSQAVATVRIAPGAAPGYRELRVEGPDGVSNLVLVRLDTLPHVLEVEPNDEPSQSQRLGIGTAVAGVIRSKDVDHFRVEGPPGKEVTLDLEARRVGTALTPVLTAMNGRGVAIAQARESRSGDRDCRLTVTIPKGGVLIAQVRDNVYGGNEAATYRLRVTTAPFATGMFPLGGPKGRPITVTASGGSLRTPLAKRITLPDTPGAIVDPGPFDGPDGPVAAPMSIVVGGEDELFATPIEAMRKPRDAEKTSIRVGQTTNGRLEFRGAVDRYAMTVKKGQKFRIKVVAEPLGSWLDSVLTVRDKDGDMLGENDDSSLNPDFGGQRGVNNLGLAQESVDSLLDFEAPSDGPIAIEVADRYGEGGPEYAYRLSVGATRPDFAVHVLIGNPNANGQVFNAANNRAVMATPGIFGVYNLRPGTKVPVNFLVVPQGRPGPVTVRVEGLPEGVTVEPVKVEVLGPGSKGGSPALVNAPAKAGNFVLDVATYAWPGVSEFKVVASAEPEPGVALTRVASATIGLDAVPSNIPARPITRRVERFPLRIVGEPRPRFVGPPEEPELMTVRVPGVLLQGDRIEVGLEFDQSPLIDPGFRFEAKGKGVGLSMNTVVASKPMLPDSDEESAGDVLVRVLASPRAVPGVYPVTIGWKMTAGRLHTTDALVIVRPPVEVLTRAETLLIKPGGSAGLWVGLRREPMCGEDVEIKVEGLPPGMKLAEPVTLKGTASEAVLNLEMAGSAPPVTRPTAVRVVAAVRMPRGTVHLVSGNRPMIAAAPAER